MPVARPIFFVISWLVASQACAASEWFWQAEGKAEAQDYQGASRLQNQFGVDAVLAGDYLERGGFRLGYRYRHKNFIAVSDHDPENLNEHILHFGGFGNFYPHHLHGRLTLRLDTYVGRDQYGRLSTGLGSGSLQPNSTDHILVLNPQIAHLDIGKTRYVDLGYAYSRYRGDGAATDNLYAHQWAPTLGVGFNHAHDWLQVRAFYIRLSNNNRVVESRSTKALEFKWSRWFAGDAPFGMRNFALTLLAGERRHAVDSDERALNTSPDLQKRALSLLLQWKVDERASVSVRGSFDRYENTALKDEYNSLSLMATLSRKY